MALDQVITLDASRTALSSKILGSYSVYKTLYHATAGISGSYPTEGGLRVSNPSYGIAVLCLDGAGGGADGIFPLNSNFPRYTKI